MLGVGQHGVRSSKGIWVMFYMGCLFARPEKSVLSSDEDRPTLRVQVPNSHIVIPKTCTVIAITLNPSTYSLGTWALRALNPKPYTYM